MENLNKVFRYLCDCVIDMPKDVLPVDPDTNEADFETILTAIGNVLCQIAWSIGASKEDFLVNIMDIWDQIEESREKEEAAKVLN